MGFDTDNKGCIWSTWSSYKIGSTLISRRRNYHWVWELKTLLCVWELNTSFSFRKLQCIIEYSFHLFPWDVFYFIPFWCLFHCPLLYSNAQWLEETLHPHRNIKPYFVLCVLLIELTRYYVSRHMFKSCGHCFDHLGQFTCDLDLQFAIFSELYFVERLPLGKFYL